MIKPLTALDIDKILDVQDGFLDGWNKEMMVSAFNEKNFFALGKFFGDTLVGFITVMTALDSADLETVVVSPNFRKQGIATTLIKSAEDMLKNMGVKDFFLEVREKNSPAINTYIKNGFKKISVRKKYYKDGENAIVMQKGV